MRKRDICIRKVQNISKPSSAEPEFVRTVVEIQIVVSCCIFSSPELVSDSNSGSVRVNRKLSITVEVDICKGIIRKCCISCSIFNNCILDINIRTGIQAVSLIENKFSVVYINIACKIRTVAASGKSKC